jgi:hypothetical protein
MRTCSIRVWLTEFLLDDQSWPGTGPEEAVPDTLLILFKFPWVLWQSLFTPYPGPDPWTFAKKAIYYATDTHNNLLNLKGRPVHG